MTRRTLGTAALIAALATGCGFNDLELEHPCPSCDAGAPPVTPPPPADAGNPDGGGELNDAGLPDSGPVLTPDAGGPADAGTPPDAGPADAGVPTDAGDLDAGSADAGSADAGTSDAGTSDSGIPDVDGGPPVCSPETCAAPPPTCQGSAVLYSYGATCDAGACAYQSYLDECPNGCANGMCKPTGWTSMSLPPANYLHGVWGAHAHSVWAVGEYGTVLHYDGSSWSQVPVGTSTTMFTSVRGTAEDNVFAGTTTGLIYRYDGSQWQPFAQVPPSPDGGTDDLCLFANGPEDVWALIDRGSIWSLYRVTGSGPQSVAAISFTGGIFCGLSSSGNGDLWIATDAVYELDGGRAVAMGGPVVGGAIYAATPDAVFAEGSLWDGTGWQSDGLFTSPNAITGTSAARVFAVAGDGNPTYPQPMVWSFDGGTWASTILPGVAIGADAWAAPTGEVFVVGGATQGAIFKGP